MRDYGNTNKNFGRNLKYLMNERAVSFEALQKETGVPHTSLNEYTRGMRAIRLETAKKIASYFGLTVDQMTEPLEGLNGFENKANRQR